MAGKMHMRLPVIDSLLAMVRNFRGISSNGKRGRAVEAVDKHSEMCSVHFQPQNKRRKEQTFLSVNSKYIVKMMNWLGKDEINAIGIYGMGGIGKTTLAKQLHIRVKDQEIHVTAWISVGMDFTVYQLQQKIADAFGFDLQNDKDVTRRSGMIYAFLSCKDKCILFLDDLWGEFRREEVGIPRKCKLVVISRMLDVCRMLRCQKIIRVEPLSEEEGMQLFHYSMGAYDVSNQELSVRNLVVNECAGLPLAVIALANIMKGAVNSPRWGEIVESVDPFSMGSTQLEDILGQLKLSYNRLNSAKLQHCFLCTALYPKGYPISKEELIRLWIGEGLIDEMSSWQEQYDMGHTILNKLLNSCLLESCQHTGIVRMHDLVWRMALSIDSNGLMVNDGLPSKLEFSGSLKFVSLINSSISLIPSDASLKCANLSTLILQQPFEVIPESFFFNMRALRVLSLSDTRIIRLPSSISALDELRVLDLSSCQKLQHVCPITQLYKLRFLDLSQTAVEEVPRSLEMLNKLTELNLSSITEPKILGVLPALSKLKKLSCHISGIIHELQVLESLKVLDARFDNLLDLSNYVRSQHWRTLECFHLQVGYRKRLKKSYSRAVSLQGCILSARGREQVAFPDDLLELYLDNCSGFSSLSDIVCGNNTENFKQQADVFSSLVKCTIRRCHDVEKLLSPSCMQNLPSLELLKVEECHKLRVLIVEEIGTHCHSEGKDAAIDLSQLKQLVLTSLPQLNNIYKGRLICAQLWSFTVIDCPNLKHLPFSNNMGDVKELITSLEWIEGQQKWWDSLELDGMESKALLTSFFRCRSSMDVC
ncbi:disease resistance protein At4g27190-like [Chenopodium quinoa]|uniref:NB-ARC domain-containing protein n=1 Tax=Chenopodium quinoa TaxID=63459 RepID=A0A803M9Q3_CHEQI|nr:disease resistance protein At4g27190-like [Chenopodium quinoa]